MERVHGHIEESGVRSERAELSSLFRETALAFSLAISALLIVSSIGCATSSVQQPPSAGDVAVSVASDFSDEVEIEITGVDIESPIIAELSIESGVAHGVVEGVEAGPNRLILISSYDINGRRCAREINTDVLPGGVTSVELSSLQCSMGELDVLTVASTSPF